MPHTSVSYRSINADGIEVFYREAGHTDAPVLMLLHGFANSSHMFRHLMPVLSDRFRMIAPDFPGFGFTEVPNDRAYVYSFATLANTFSAFVKALGLTRYVMYVFDYGAPIGLRHAMMHPEQIVGIVSQNGNAYQEGLGDAWEPIRQYWKEPTSERAEPLRGLLTLDKVRESYLDGVPDPSTMAPEAWWLDSLLLQRPGNAEIQLALMLDYASNVALYPQFQAYFRATKPNLLAIWGRYDPFFVPAGAEAFRRDIPEAYIQFVNAGHFALETDVHAIALAILEVVPRFFG
jgi:pimeloyl-ACP methyl ester carboxylesterase